MKLKLIAFLQFQQLQSEKDILAKEVVSLREELHRARDEGRNSINSNSSAISDYSPSNPKVLQRKISK